MTGDCIWSWQPRKAGGKAESKKLACKDKLTIARVPYSLDRAQSGVSVTVKLPDGRELAERDVVVEDLFIVALGDFVLPRAKAIRTGRCSSAPSREMVYDPKLLRDEVAMRTGGAGAEGRPGSFGLASSDDQVNPKVLPRRLMEDELGGALQQADFAGLPRRLRQGGAALARAATATARNTAIRSASASSWRSRTAIAR